MRSKFDYLINILITWTYIVREESLVGEKIFISLLESLLLIYSFQLLLPSTHAHIERERESS